MKEKIIQNMEKWIENHPEDTNQFLDSISKSLNKFKEAAIRSQNNKAYNSIDSLFHLLLSDKKKRVIDNLKDEEKAVFYIDAIMYMFPHGWSDIKSEVQRKTLGNFCWWYKNSNLQGSYWESNAKNMSAYINMLLEQYVNYK